MNDIAIQGPPEIVAAIQRGETVKGWVPVVDVAGTTLNDPVVKIVPWDQVARVHSLAKGETEDHWNPDYGIGEGPVAIPEEEIARIQANAPKPVPIPHSERLRMIVDTLVEFGRASLKVHGYVQWPASIVAELQAMGWRSGNPTAWEDQIEPLARRFITQAANQVKEADAHKVTLDHAGRYSA